MPQTAVNRLCDSPKQEDLFLWVLRTFNTRGQHKLRTRCSPLSHRDVKASAAKGSTKSSMFDTHGQVMSKVGALGFAFISMSN